MAPNGAGSFFFLANPDLVNILVDTDFDFENLYFFVVDGKRLGLSESGDGRCTLHYSYYQGEGFQGRGGGPSGFIGGVADFSKIHFGVLYGFFLHSFFMCCSGGNFFAFFVILVSPGAPK